MNKDFRRRVAVLLTAAMTIGSAFTSFAAPNLTGKGENIGHLYAEDVVTVTVPAEETLKHYFDFTLDPERLINSAEVIEVTTGSTVETHSAVGNDAGVYFRTNGNSFGAISTVASISVKNFRDAEISFEVGVKSGAAGDFELVESKPTATTTQPALYIGVIATNGGIATNNFTTHAITEAGIKYVDTFGAQSTNYKILNTADWSATSKSAVNNAKYAAVESEGAIWNSFQFQLDGYVSHVDVESSFKAPVLEYTWKLEVRDPNMLNMIPNGAGGYYYEFATALGDYPITDLYINGVQRLGAVTKENVKYNNTTKRVTVKADTVTNMNLKAGDKLKVKINDVWYKFVLKDE